MISVIQSSLSLSKSVWLKVCPFCWQLRRTNSSGGFCLLFFFFSIPFTSVLVLSLVCHLFWLQFVLALSFLVSETEILMMWDALLHTVIGSYEFLSECCFSCIPWALIRCVFKFIHVKVTSNVPCNLWLCSEISMYLSTCPTVLLLLVSNLTSLWSEITLCMTSILANVPRCVLGPSTRSILEIVPCT